MMNHPVLMKVHLSLSCSVPGTHLGTWEAGIMMWLWVPAAWEWGGGQVRVSSTKGDLSPNSAFHKWVSSGVGGRGVHGHGAKQESLLIGRSPSECQLQHLHQQLRFHCWDNYGEWIKTQAATYCLGDLSPWNIYLLYWSCSRRWEIWCFSGLPGIWTFFHCPVQCFEWRHISENVQRARGLAHAKHLGLQKQNSIKRWKS